MPAPEILPSLIEASAGMTSEQIQEQILTSEVADKVEDPAALADMLVRCNEDPDYAAQLMLDDGASGEAPEEEQPIPADGG